MKKEVLFLIPTLGGGGAERVLVNLVNGLNRDKYSVTIQTIFKSGVNAQFLDKDISFKQGIIKQFRGSTFLLLLFPPKELFKRIIGSGYDIVVSYLEGPAARVVSGCTDPGVIKVGWIHCVHKNVGEVLHSFRSRSEAKRCYYSFDAMAYVSQQVKDDFLRYFPGIKCNYVIHNTNDEASIQSMANENVTDMSFSDEINVISVGRLLPVKGYERLVEAHSRLIRNGFRHHVYIVGKGELELELQQYIQKHDVESTFHLIGFKSNPYQYINRADIFVCSSYSEGFSTAVTEALILGKPVVSTDVSGAKEMLGENNEYGLVVDNSTEGIYEGLKTLLQNDELLGYYTAQATKRGKLFSKATSISEVENLLDSLSYYKP